MKRWILMVMSMLMCMLWSSAMVAGQENQSIEQLLDELQQQGVISEDEEWEQEFSRSLTRGYRESHIHPQTLTVVARMLKNNRVSGDPDRAAAVILEAARDADRAIRRGREPMVVREELRQRIEQHNLRHPETVGDITRKQARERVENNLKNRGRGQDPDFIPPGLEKKNRRSPPFPSQGGGREDHPHEDDDYQGPPEGIPR